MSGNQVHFEVFVRRYPDSPWTLKMAVDDRESALEAAMEMVDQREAAAARVMRETLEAGTGEFHSLTILTVGAPERARKIRTREPAEPLCVAPQDLYTCHAREKIGRLLETWLARRQATPFELLHRPDLVEQLEASRVEIQHAIQKIALPEAHARNCSVVAMTKSFESLTERAVERLMRDARKGLPRITAQTFAKTASQLAADPEAAYRLGCGVAMFLAPARSWSEKVGLLIDLADAAPPEGPARALALAVIAEPLEEIVGCEKGLDDVVGGHLDLGGRLAAMSRLAAADVIDALVKLEPSVAKVMPELSERAQGLAKWLGGGGFLGVRAAIGQRILRELSGQRRLRPADAAGEIDVIRGLAMALTAASGKLLPLDNVQAAFSSRSRRLVTRDFVETYLGEGASSLEEAEALIWLTENIIGGGNKREAGRWLHSQIFSLRFERESRGSHHPTTRLAELSKLQRAVARCGLVEETYQPIQIKLGEVGGLVEADARLVSMTVKSTAPALNRLTLLLRIASGEVAPLGPAADRARAEALKLARQDNTRAELTVAPDRLDAIRDLLRHASLAA
ncbi:hypothetical protein [Phenylobacterium sp.]|uniref:hypothetical protein n=1 Tax=Phenylobacterium sp. TaxID=1871053 RepID=UPI00286B4EE5|nr:hypothetical protein [Phenylobacterium sp.]